MKLIKKNHILTTIITFAVSSSSLMAFTHEVHKNLPEDAMIFMETQGSLQQRWVADYMKAKIKGRYNGHCEQIHYDNPSDFTDGDVQCGTHGLARVGGIGPDYFKDNFWDLPNLLITGGFNWHWKDYGLYGNNFTSWQHFINLLKKSDSGLTLKTDNHNDYDGYAFNATYGFPSSMSVEGALAIAMGNSRLSIDLPNCTHSACSNKYNRHPNANPVVDYRQNGSRTPIGNACDASSCNASCPNYGYKEKYDCGWTWTGYKCKERSKPCGDVANNKKKIANSLGSNYNCFSDTATLDCPDVGTKIGGEYQQPNTDPGGKNYDDNTSWYKPWTWKSVVGDQDWIIYEPADNLSTFYYNEMFLEGGSSRNGKLDPDRVTGRYYNIGADEMIYLGFVQHWIGDMNQQSHIWATVGYNHGDYEYYVDEQYGLRKIGQNDAEKNYEIYSLAEAHQKGRQNRGNTTSVGNIDRFLMEQAFYTYHVRLRDGYDTLKNTDKAIWKKAGKWAVNSGVAQMALVFEKGILDLRKCRNSSSCQEY